MEEQTWFPTSVQVTVLRGRGLRGKGKHGTSDVYTVIQLGKEKYCTGVAEKTTEPEWREECSFELQPGALQPSGSPAELQLTVMHRALIGLDVFLGQTLLRLDLLFQDSGSFKNRWLRLHSKTGKKEKERGELQVSVQFTRNHLTASMYDLVMKDTSASTFSKLKEHMKGVRRSGQRDSSSAVLPGGYGSLYRMRQRLPSDGGGEEDYEDDEGGEARRSKMRTFFLRGKLRKSSDTRSSTSLGSESSESSSRGGSLSPTAGISVVVSDMSNSPSNSSNLTDNSPEHNPSSLQCEFGDDGGEFSIMVPPPSACVHGPQDPPAGPSGLLHKPLPLSTSLQNLGTRLLGSPGPSGTPGPASDGRRWSFDKPDEEEKAAIAAALEKSGPMLRAASSETSGTSTAQSENQQRTQKRDQQGLSGQAPGDKHKGWFGTKDKPSPHPVKPLTAATPPEERRSVLVSGLEKLKSTIHPGRSGPPGEQDTPRKKGLTEGAGSYYHLTHSELVALLVQREADLRRQKLQAEHQKTLLAKRELELRRLKPQVRDLEDYIDTLLVRIMEQKPTLLQVRSKLK